MISTTTSFGGSNDERPNGATPPKKNTVRFFDGRCVQHGVELIARRDPVAADSLAEWLRSLVDDYSDRILAVDLDVALTWARLGVPDPVPVVDGLLAATALTHDLILVTRNESGVEATGVQLFNPFS